MRERRTRLSLSNSTSMTPCFWLRCLRNVSRTYGTSEITIDRLWLARATRDSDPLSNSRPKHIGRYTKVRRRTKMPRSDVLQPSRAHRAGAEDDLARPRVERLQVLDNVPAGRAFFAPPPRDIAHSLEVVVCERGNRVPAVSGMRLSKICEGSGNGSTARI